MAAPRFILEDFWPSDLFLGGVPGAWYDPTDVNVNWRRNLLTYTEQFDNAAWSLANATITANTTVAPDGTTTADRINPTASTGFHYVTQTIALTVGVSYTVSVYFKQVVGGSRYAFILIGGANKTAVFDMQTATVSFTSTGIASATMQDAGSGWYRCALVIVPTLGDGNVFLGPTTAANSASSTTAITDQVLLWGAQLEAGSTATTYQQIVTPEITYAATQTTNLFQDSAGTTPVTAVEQPVGLILDKSQGLARGPEVVTNGTFATNVTGWTAQAGDTLSWDSGNGGRLKIDDTNSSGAGIAYQIINTVAGTTYAVTFTSSLGTSAQTRIYVGTAVGNASMGVRVDNANVTNGTLYFVASGATAYLQFVCQSTTAFSYLDDISVVAIAGNHASQSTAASRPTYRARYNLLTQSEDFGNAAWTKTTGGSVTANAAVAPDGTTTADLVYASSTGNYRSVYQATTGRTISVYAKASGKSWVWFINVSAAAACAWFDVSSGTVGTVVAGYTASVQSVGSGWYRCTVTGPSNFQFVQIGPSDADNTPTVTASGTDGILLWGAQSLTAADVTATGNAYQRIAAATVYDTAPIFRPYLAFDGVDDSLSTSAINFTSTDKMTVFAGVTKSSDATLGIVAELGNRNLVQAGSFTLNAPRAAGNPNYAFIVEGTAVTDNTITGYPAPITSVMTGRGDIAAPLNQLRVNGAVAGTLTTTLGTGNFGNWALNIGRRNNTSFPLNGRIYELIVRGAASSTTEIIDTETWVNARTGAY